MNAVMSSMEPHRTRTYSEDLKWWMAYQRHMLELTYQQIVKNLSVDISTVWKAVESFRMKELLVQSTVKVLKHRWNCRNLSSCRQF